VRLERTPRVHRSYCTRTRLQKCKWQGVSATTEAFASFHARTSTFCCALLLDRRSTRHGSVCSGQSKRFTSAHRRPFPDAAIQVRASIDASPVRLCLTGEGWNGIDDAAVFGVAGVAVQAASFMIMDIVIPARGSGVARDGNPHLTVHDGGVRSRVRGYIRAPA
jgi:hypothetical protein